MAVVIRWQLVRCHQPQPLFSPPPSGEQPCLDDRNSIYVLTITFTGGIYPKELLFLHNYIIPLLLRDGRGWISIIIIRTTTFYILFSLFSSTFYIIPNGKTYCSKNFSKEIYVYIYYISRKVTSQNSRDSSRRNRSVFLIGSRVQHKFSVLEMDCQYFLVSHRI